MTRSKLMWLIATIIAFLNLLVILGSDGFVSLFKAMVFIASFMVANMWFVGAFIVEQMENKK